MAKTTTTIKLSDTQIKKIQEKALEIATTALDFYQKEEYMEYSYDDRERDNPAKDTDKGSTAFTAKEHLKVIDAFIKSPNYETFQELNFDNSFLEDLFEMPIDKIRHNLF